MNPSFSTRSVKTIFFGILSGFLVLVSPFAFSQSRGTVIGTLLDSATSKPLSYATISVFRVADTTLVTYRLSDEKGTFTIGSLPLATPLRAVISFTGYGVVRKALTLPPESAVLHLGKILLTPSRVALSAILLTAEAPPVVVRKDTIEFNASSFKTLPDALVEDLLRKLPGVSVDRNGAIVVNGRSVNKIFVDGKNFFGGDIRIASRNLPANVIDKVQVANDKEALVRDPNMADADIPQVINLKLKAGVKKGAFGKVYAGAGATSKYEGGGIVNLFRDTTQISVIGYANNINRTGFSYNDVATLGGFNRSGVNDLGTNETGGFVLNGISFGGTEEGIYRSLGSGANFNTMFKNRTELNLQYFYGKMNGKLDMQTDTRQTFNDTLFTTLNTRRVADNRQSHNLGAKIAIPKLGRFSDVNFVPTLSLRNEDAEQNIKSLSFSETQPLVNKGDNDGHGSGRIRGVSSLFWWTLNFRKKGHNLNFYNTASYSANGYDQYNDAVSEFFAPASRAAIHQLRGTDSRNLQITTSLNYTDPITKKLSLIGEYTLENFHTRNDVSTFSYNPITGGYDSRESAFSDEWVRTGARNIMSTGLSYREKTWRLNASVKMTDIAIRNTFANASPLIQHYLYVAPYITGTYKKLSFTYNVTLRAPEASDLQSVANNTNPLYIQQGNPSLRPVVANTLRVSFRKFDTKKLTTYNISVTGTANGHAIIQQRSISSDGVQTAYPVNVRGVWTLGNNLSFQKDKKFSTNRQISLITSNYVTYTHSSVMLNATTSRYTNLAVRPGGEFRLNLNDRFEFNQLYTLNYQKNAYDDPSFHDLDVVYQDSRTELIVRAPLHLVWETTVDYRSLSNAGPTIQRNYYRWNAAVTLVFLDGRRGQLKLAVNDLLNQNTNNYSTARENYVQQRQVLQLKRYGLMTFTYNIRNFGAKVGGRNQLLRF